jgi:hypothetical protein
MRWPLAKSNLTRLLSRLSESCDPADQQFCDALEEAIRRADQAEQLREVNQDLRGRLAGLEAGRPAVTDGPSAPCHLSRVPPRRL